MATRWLSVQDELKRFQVGLPLGEPFFFVVFYALRRDLRIILGSESLSNGFRKSKYLTGTNNVSEVFEEGTGRQMALSFP
jgi:hypothetical protein